MDSRNGICHLESPPYASLPPAAAPKPLGHLSSLGESGPDNRIQHTHPFTPMRKQADFHAPTALGRTARRFGLLALAAGTLLTGCNSSSSPDQGTSQAGTIGTNPGTNRFFIVDENKAGFGSELRVSRLAWGRLVDVFGLDSTNTPVLMNENFVISPSLQSNGVDYTLETNPVTSAQRLIILRNIDDTTPGGGLDQYHDRLRLAETAIEPVFDQGLGGAGHFTMVPRNACVVIQFDDLLDPAMVDSATVQVAVGSPSIQPFESRIMIDPNHGDLADHDGVPGLEYYTTRVLIDMTVSEVESFLTNPPLPVNTIGLPPSADTNISNVAINLPTQVYLPSGHDRVLTNPTGHSLATLNNGTIDNSQSQVPVSRSFRSGGPFEVTTDPYNGFLRDTLDPRVVGVLAGDIDTVISDPLEVDPTIFRIGFTFDSEFCSQAPEPGDTISQPSGVFAEVLEPTIVTNKVVTDLKVRLVTFPATWANGPTTWELIGPGPAQYLAPFDPVADDSRPECFVQVSPVAPNPEQPTTGISSTATISVRFNEPMDPSRVTAFDAITMTRTANPTATYEYIVGDLGHSQDLHDYHFQSDLPLSHVNGQTESYFVNLVPPDPDPNRVAGPVDLAGNELTEVFPQIQLVLNSVTTESTNGGRASLFTTADEEEPIGDPQTGATLAEWGGQHLFELSRGVIRPRPVVHFQGIVDRNQVEMVQAMLPTLVGSQTPLSRYGSRSQILWRHMDMDLGLIEHLPPTSWEIQETLFNLDVEGLSWAPFGGEVNPETYPQFEILLSHTNNMPDEMVGAGLVDFFENNPSSLTEDPQRVVHPRHEGYSIHPGDLYVVNQNLRLLPFPMNTQVSPENYRYYTYRDTSIRVRGGDAISGSPTVLWYQSKNIPVPCEDPSMGACIPPPCTWAQGCLFNPLYPAGEVQTVGLPLLMEFRCWQTNSASGTNYFDTSTAAAGTFRAHSTGGIDQNLGDQFIDPGTEDRANGGFDPNSIPSGAPTAGLDSEVYMGAADFVVRVSRSHSVWFPAVDPNNPGTVFSNPAYNEPTFLPGPLDQPLGTTVEFDFRGALAVTEAEPLQDASTLDAYGDWYANETSTCNDGSFTHTAAQANANSISFNPNVDTWFDTPASINGAQYYQVRITWTSNPVTGLVPELTAFGMTWMQQ